MTPTRPRRLDPGQQEGSQHHQEERLEDAGQESLQAADGEDKHRVLQMDGVNPAECDPTKSPARESWKTIGITPDTTPLAVQVTISG